MTSATEKTVATLAKVDDVSKGLDAAAVLATKVDLDSPRWSMEITDPALSSLTGNTVTPLHLIMAADDAEESENKAKRSRAKLAGVLFTFATECKHAIEFEAFCLTIKHDAGWKKYPEIFRNTKSRIMTNFKNPEVPHPADEVMLPLLNPETGKVKDFDKLEKRGFRNMDEYYRYCKGLDKAISKNEKPIKSEVTSSEGVMVTPTSTIITDSEGHKVAEDSEPDPFTTILASLQVLYAQATDNEKVRMLKRVKSLESDISKAQENRFKDEDSYNDERMQKQEVAS